MIQQNTKDLFQSWRKFLIESPVLTEISPQYITQVKSWLDKVSPDKLSFNSIFGNKFRIVLPFENKEDDNKILSSLNPNYEDLYTFLMNLKYNGFKLDLKKYTISKEKEEIIPKGPKQGQKIKRNKEQKIGRYIQNLIELTSKIENVKTFDDSSYEILRTIKKLYPNFDYSSGRNWLEWFRKVLKEYEEFSSSNPTNTVLAIIISRHPIDVLRMSDFQHIQSCHSEGGAYFNCAIDESKGHGLVAYVVKKHDLDKVNLEGEEIFKDKQRDIDGIVPLSRLRLRRIFDIKNKVEYAVPENVVYGDRIGGFKEAIKAWAGEQVQKIDVESDPKDLRYTGGKYTDTAPFDMFQDLMRISKKDTDLYAAPDYIRHFRSREEEEFESAVSQINRTFTKAFNSNVKIDNPYVQHRTDGSTFIEYDLIIITHFHDMDEIGGTKFNNYFKNHSYELLNFSKNKIKKIFNFNRDDVEHTSQEYNVGKSKVDDFKTMIKEIKGKSVEDFINRFKNIDEWIEKIETYELFMDDILYKIFQHDKELKEYFSAFLR